jgi:hypothetical protein
MLSITELTQRVKATPVSLSHSERIALLQDAHILDSDEKLNLFFQVKCYEKNYSGSDKQQVKQRRPSYSDKGSN